MIYLVAGGHRCGTSMMMEALAAASTLRPLVDHDADEFTRRTEVDASYVPNARYWSPPRFTPADAVPAGSLLKCHALALPTLAPGRYQVVAMSRYAGEQIESYRRAFGFVYTPAMLDAHRDHLRRAADRPDMTVTFLDYGEVVADPAAAFGRLHADGWPIDTAAAAAVVDPRLYRNRAASTTRLVAASTLRTTPPQEAETP